MFQQKSLRVLFIVFIVYGVLVATHKGEFWPFSIYPMFSKAGNPWTRALVRDVTEVPDSLLWEVYNLNNLAGEPVSMASIGVDQIDYSNFVSKTKQWDEQRIGALRYMLGEKNFNEKRWMIMKVKGALVGDDSVHVQIIPHLLFVADTTLLNPTLPRSAYFSE